MFKSSGVCMDVKATIWNTKTISRGWAFSWWAAFSSGKSQAAGLESSKLQALTHQETPRSLQGMVIQHHPITDQKIQYFPLKDEFVVENEEIPSFQDILYTYYWPKVPSPNDKARYISEKTGMKVDDVAAEMYRRRRLKWNCAQTLRFRFQSRTIRCADPPNGKYWEGIDRAYQKCMFPIVNYIGLSNYSSPWLDPHIVYSPQYKMCVNVDAVLHTEVRVSRQYALVDVVTSNTMPKHRIPGVIGQPRAPLHNLEPSAWHEIQLRLSVATVLLKDNGYVVDWLMDGGHNYNGIIIHLYEAPQTPGGVAYDLHEMPMQLGLAYDWLLDYAENVLGSEVMDQIPNKGRY